MTTTTESLESAGVHPWTWDAVADRVQWTEGVARLFGVELKSFKGTLEAVMALVYPADRERMRVEVEAAIRGGKAEFNIQHRVQWPNGELRWVEGRASVVRSADGRAVELRGAVWDATWSKRAEQREQRSRRLLAVMAAINRESARERELARLLDSACRIVVEEGGFRFAWIGLKGEGGRVKPVVRAGFEDGYLEVQAIQAIGTDAREGPTMRAIRGHVPAICNDIANDPAYLPWRDAALSRGYRASAAFPVERGGEAVGTLNVYADQPGVFEHEEVQLLSRLAADIGGALERAESDERRRKAEAALAASEERYRALFEQAGDGIMQFSAERKIIDVNSAMCTMHGYSRDELVGQPIGVLMADPGIVDRLKVTERLERGEVFRTERLARRKDGTTFPVESSVTRLETGERLAVVRDVSVRNRLAAEVAQHERLLALGRLARGIAHEINNPLAYVMMNLELVERVADPKREPSVAAAVSSALEGSDRVRRIVRDLSTFGRGEEEEIGPVDVDAVLGSALNLTVSALKPVAAVVRDFRARHKARGNAYRLGQVAVNLLINAADAIGAGARPNNQVTLGTFSDGEWVGFSVADTGPGIEPAIASKIFDPFFTTKPVGAGTGLGLSIAHTIVSALGGTLTVSSTPGAGATFTVKLPVWNEAQPPASAPPAAAPVAGRKRKILVVDDEPAIRRGLVAALPNDEVTTAAGGLEAAELCRTQDFDCVLCDVVMPQGDGASFLLALRQQGKGADRKVIFMSGGAYSAKLEGLLEHLDNPRLDKPFTTAAVSEAIDRLLSRR